jgi:hypothetical protein
MLRLSKVLPLSFALATLAFAALTIFVSCTSGNTTQARFINGISDASSLDIEVNGTREFSSIGFGQASGSTYAAIPAGTDAIQGFAAGTTTVAFQGQNVPLNAGSQYTLVAAGLLTGNVNILHPVDNNTQPTVNTTSFRVINASSFGPGGGGGAADIYILPNPVVGNISQFKPTITNLSYGATSSYANQTDNSNTEGYTMYVTPTGNPTPTFSVGLNNVGTTTIGAICTLVLTDQANGSAMSQIPVALDDLNCSGVLH